MNVFKYESDFAVSPETLWAWLERPGAFARMQPPWMHWRPIELPKSLKVGEQVRFKFKKNGLWISWDGRHVESKPPFLFIDEQVKGPFKSWVHQHRIEKTATGCRMIDEIKYQLPLGFLSEKIGGTIVGKELAKLFKWRASRLEGDLTRYANKPQPEKKTVLVTGHSGMIGSPLVSLLRVLGYQVRGLTRSPKQDWEYHWDPEKKQIDTKALDGVSGIIHLAGENIAGGRWTEKKKKSIIDSRILSTQLLFETAEALPNRKLKTFISASGVNYYAPDGYLKSEQSNVGNDFLAHVCQEWEAASKRFEDLGCRVCCLRTGIVLDPLGGVLNRLLLPFQLGLGGPLGTGQQGFPWISIDDLCDLYLTTLADESYNGAINAVAPDQIMQKQFAKVLGSVLGRPAFLPLPAPVIRAFFGEMGEVLLLGDLSVAPHLLEEKGFRFRHSKLDLALSHLLGRF